MFFKIGLGIIALVIIISLISDMVAIVQENHEVLVTTWGKYSKTLKPGFHFVIPIMQRAIDVDKSQITLELDQETVITKDNAEVNVTVSINYHVFDTQKYVFQNQDSIESVKEQTKSELRDIIGGKDLNDILNQSNDINAKLQQALNDMTSTYGIKVDRINITNLSPIDSIQEAMDKQVRADREKIATIKKAEGEAEAIERTADANMKKVEKEADAKKYQVQATADAEAYRIKTVNEQLAKTPDEYFLNQKIDALREIGQSKNNTIIMPTDITKELDLLPAATKIVEASKDKTADQTINKTKRNRTKKVSNNDTK